MCIRIINLLQAGSGSSRWSPRLPSDEPQVQFTLSDIVCVKLGFDSKVLLAQVSPSLHYQVALLPLVLPFYTKRLPEVSCQRLWGWVLAMKLKLN